MVLQKSINFKGCSMAQIVPVEKVEAKVRSSKDIDDKSVKSISVKKPPGIKFIEGATDILIIAPHGVNVPGVKNDDNRTDILARAIAKKLKCSALINDSVKRSECNYNRIADATQDKRFIASIRKVLDTKGPTLVVWIHGMKEKRSLEESEELGLRGALDCVVGYGQPNRYSAQKDTVETLAELFSDHCIAALPTDDRGNFRARSMDNMNQWFRQQKEYDDRKKVQSLQLEFKEDGFRNSEENCRKTAKIIFQALSALVRPQEQDTKSPNEKQKQPTEVKPIVAAEEVVQNVDESNREETSDDTLVDQAYERLKETFRKHFHNAMVEAGRYIIDTFYDGKDREALAKNKTKEQPPNLKRLINKIREASNNPSESAPSIAWFYNAVNLAAHEAICEKEGFQTFRMLEHSHKLQLLSVPKLKEIQKDKFDEAIRPAFEVKEKLAKVALREKYSVREFKDHIKRKLPSNQKQNTKTLLKRHEKQLIKMVSQAKEQIQPDGPLAGAYESVLRQVEALLGEIKKAEEKKPKKSSNSSEKQKVQTKDGTEIKATTPLPN
jgi:hypothetical protein